MSYQYDNLMIVESPTKASTIAGFLRDAPGRWLVKATRGHIQNLPNDRHGIEHANGQFRGEWVYTKGKKELARELVGDAKNALEAIYIATDGDYEGERIASDLFNVAGIGKLGKPCYRIVFRQITKDHILEVLQNTTEGLIDGNSVDAQKARRMIYREVGFPISQILLKDFKRNREKELPEGTGNVIAPALRLIVEAERKIDVYVEMDFEKVYADYIFDGVHIRLVMQAKFQSEHSVELSEILHTVRNSPHIVKEYDEKDSEKSPPKPLTTSGLQRGAWYLFGIEEEGTMRLAQKLFEGLELYGKRTGLITYMRTDSHHIAKEASEEAIQIVEQLFGEEYTLYGIRDYSQGKSEDESQEEHPHEAIRPTQFSQEYWPDNIKEQLLQHEDGESLLKIYRFIYNSFLCVQMPNAQYDRSRIEVSAGGNLLLGQANQQLFDGWEIIGHEIRANYKDQRGHEKEVILPPVEEGIEVGYIDVSTMSLSSRSPERYGRGRFITTLENKGIGKPSTLATVIKSLMKKKYIKELNDGNSKKHKTLKPTDLGRKVYAWHELHVPWLIDLETAKKLEEFLVKVEKGEMPYNELIGIFHESVEELKRSMGYDLDGPTEGQISLAKKIAKQKGQMLDNNFLASAKIVSLYIKENIDALETICTCSVCGKGELYDGEVKLACNNPKCDFEIWKNRMDGFFEAFKVEMQQKDCGDVVKIIMENGDVLINNMTGKKGHPFSAEVDIAYDKKYKNYSLHIKKFVKDDMFKSVESSAPEVPLRRDTIDAPVDENKIMAEVPRAVEPTKQAGGFEWN
ncbi:MAG: DNA topoisomerase [Campylobacterota bacterium]|nr:DNA topoisomerase [Campylobacterota bacterium]